MGLARDSSLPLPNLADCLDIGNQSGPGKTSVGPQQGRNLAGTATGKPSLPLTGAQFHASKGGGEGSGPGCAGRGGERKRVAAGLSWVGCPLSLVGLRVPRGWDT